MDYFRKMKGGTQSPPRVSMVEILWSWVGAMLGIAAVAAVHYRWLAGTGLILIIGSFGASAVLVYGAVRSPLAQPRNLVGGHVISALIGVAAYRFLGGEGWLPASAAVATAIAAMHATRTLHPPGGATALIAVIGGEPIHRLGFLYALFPAALGALILLAVALAVNNIPKNRKYPEFWV
jgi:CBS-domain-containing membrane protein